MTNKELIKHYWADLRCITLFPKRYNALPAGPVDWRKVSRDYGNLQKRIGSTDYRWYIITYDDGRKVLSYLRELSGGFFTGLQPAIYRGIIVPRLVTNVHFSHIREVRLAF